ncbi:flagellar basal body-associated protein FliL [Sphingomonas sp.]|uniref:flagellar basal body-associated FliL family protein n=1 Tax=Sphingomonas sp. TaxID=28214 RepID=UPI001DE78C97|nr:flagellar basal body-associated FliL family protein [Sphingomonas sp.]MBX9795352.1 flagellar basal body-associated FliL family protein [Sphingomonas sp.]
MAKAEDKEEKNAKKGGNGLVKILVLVIVVLVLVGGGVAGGIYAMNTGMLGSKGEHGESYDAPKLVPKSEEKRAGGDEGGHGGGGGGGHAGAPLGAGGDKYASSYYQMDKEFTSNLKDSVHFIQVGLAVSTPYDSRVIDGLKTHEIAVRSAILLALGDATEEQMFTADGKRLLQANLVKAINAVLKQKEGFGGISNVYFTNFVVQ